LRRLNLSYVMQDNLRHSYAYC